MTGVYASKLLTLDDAHGEVRRILVAEKRGDLTPPGTLGLLLLEPGDVGRLYADGRVEIADRVDVDQVVACGGPECRACTPENHAPSQPSTWRCPSSFDELELSTGSVEQRLPTFTLSPRPATRTVASGSWALVAPLLLVPLALLGLLIGVLIWRRSRSGGGPPVDIGLAPLDSDGAGRHDADEAGPAGPSQEPEAARSIDRARLKRFLEEHFNAPEMQSWLADLIELEGGLKKVEWVVAFNTSRAEVALDLASALEQRKALRGEVAVKVARALLEHRPHCREDIDALWTPGGK
ncbi:MAG: hypothetical protein R3B82_18425 [Sandaracinaceae bacterium]